MNLDTSAPAADPSEISALIETLLATEQRLEELTGGEVDTVAGQDGRTFMLRRAQEQARHRGASKQAALNTELRVLFDLVPAMIWFKDTQDRILRVNQRVADVAGKSIEEIEGKLSVENYPKEAARHYEDDLEVIHSGRPKIGIIETIRNRDGEAIWIQTDKVPYRDEDGKVIGIVVMAHDITERKHISDALRASQANMAIAQRIAHFGSWEVILTNSKNLDANVLHWSDEMFRIAGYEPGAVEVSNELFFRLVHPDDRESIRQAMAMAVRERREYSIVHRLIRPDGETRVLQETAQIFFDETTGHPAKIVGTAHDITERNRSELVIERGLQRLNEAQRIGQIGDWEYDLATQAITWSPQVFEIFGRDPRLGPPRNYEEYTALLDAACQALQTEKVVRAIESGEAQDFELRTHHPNGTPIDVLGRAVPRKDESGKVVGLVGTVQDITARKRSEEALQVSDERLRAALSASGTGTFRWNLRTNELSWDDLLDALFGLPPGRTVRSLEAFIAAVHPDDRPGVIERCERCAREGRDFSMEFRVLWPDGSLHWLDDRGKTFSDAAGEPLYMTGACVDITERKGAEEALAQRARLAGLSASIGVALIQTGSVREILQHCSEALVTHLHVAFARIWTLNETENVLELQASAGMYTHLDGPHARVPVGQFKIGLIAEERKPHLTNSVVGDPRVNNQDWARREGMVAFAGFPLLVKGRLVGVIGMFARHPLSETTLGALGSVADGIALGIGHKWIEEALRVSEAEFRALAEAMPQMVWITRPDGWNIYISQQWMDYTGLTLEESLGHGWKKPFHPEDQERAWDAWQDATRSTGTYSIECRLRRSDGVYRWWLIRAVPQLDTTGNILRWFGTCTDIDELKLAQARIEEQATMLDIAHEAILVKDLEGRIIYWNKGAERTYGWSAAEAVGRKSNELLFPDSTIVQKCMETLMAKGEWHGELNKQAKGGREMVADVGWTLVRDAQGHPKAILDISTDVSQKKKIEVQFLRAQRMEGIGTLAGGIAHDLNNVLAPILMSIEILRDEVRGEDGLVLLNTLQTSATRGAELVKQVLSFARGIESKSVKVNLIHLLREIQSIIRDTFPKSITFNLRSDPGLWLVNGDPTQLHQVFMNLCVNARDAMLSGGSLKVSIDNIVVDETYAAMNPESFEGAYVVVTVSDTGAGIAPEIRDKIYEPFFTTKAVGKGTGLGLSTTMAIVKSHGGFINLYSEKNKGTRFRIYLPANTNEAAAEAVEVEQTRLPCGNGECVLVVDDEEGIRVIAGKTLERYGYAVLMAANGAEAVALYAQHRSKIAVVLTDMAMPVMDGPATIIALRSMNPLVKIIGSSGLTSAGGVAKAVGAGVTQFIHKPYSAETLLKALNLILLQAASPTELETSEASGSPFDPS